MATVEKAAASVQNATFVVKTEAQGRTYYVTVKAKDSREAMKVAMEQNKAAISAQVVRESHLQQEIYSVSAEMKRPSVLFRPRLFIDGGKWCALYGENLQDGVAAFADSPEEAMRHFDTAWDTKLSESN